MTSSEPSGNNRVNPVPAEVILTETKHVVSVDQQRIAHKVEQLFEEGLDAALDLLQFGIAEHKISIVKSILSAATKLLGEQSDTRAVEVRLALDSLFTDMRDIDAPTVGPVTTTVDHQDEESQPTAARPYGSL